MLKNWAVLSVLAIVGIGLLIYGLGVERAPEGVTPQSGGGGALTERLLALAGAITTLGTAIFGVVGKYAEHRKAQLARRKDELELEKMRLEIEKQRRDLERD